MSDVPQVSNTVSSVDAVPPVPQESGKKGTTQLKRLNPPAGGFTSIPEIPKGYAKPKKKDFDNENHPLLYLEWKLGEVESTREKLLNEISLIKQYGGSANALAAARQTAKTVEKFQSIDASKLPADILESLKKQIAEAEALAAGGNTDGNE